MRSKLSLPINATAGMIMISKPNRRMLLSTVFTASGQFVPATASVPAGMMRPRMSRATPNFRRVSGLMRLPPLLSAAGAFPAGSGRAVRTHALFRGGRERGLPQAADLAVALQHETAAVEGGERRAMADRYDRAALEPRGEKTVERGFRRLVERGRRLVEEQVIRRLQNGAGNSKALLLAEREHPVPVCFLVEPAGERR